MTSLSSLSRIKITVTGARGAIGLEIDGDLVAGEYVVVNAGRKVQSSTGTGADAGLRTDLAAGTGAALVGLVPQGQSAPVSAKTMLDRMGYWASTAAQIQAANDAISQSGKRQTINLVPKLTIPLTTGLTIDGSLVSFNANGSILDASALTSGAAITVTGTLDPPYSQNMIELRLPELRGPLADPDGSNDFASLSVDGVLLASDAGEGEGFGPSHLTLTALNVSGFRNGVIFGNRAYLVRLERPDIHRCHVCVWQSSSPDGQENNRVVGGVLYNSDWAVRVSDDRADVSFDGVSLDSLGQIALIEAGELYLNFGHKEVVGATSFRDIPFVLSGPNSRCVWNSGNRRVPAGAKTFEVWADLAAGSTFVDNVSSAQGDISGSGAFAKGEGTYIPPRHVVGPEIRNNCYVAHQTKSRAPAVYNRINARAFILRSGDGFTQPDRYTELRDGNPSLSIVDEAGIKLVKTTGPGVAAAACILMLPIDQMDLIGGRIYFRKPGSATGRMSIAAVWGWSDPVPSGPMPNIIRSEAYATDAIDFTSAAAPLTQSTFSPLSSHRAPQGADVWMLHINLSAVSACEVFFSLPNFERVG